MQSEDQIKTTAQRFKHSYNAFQNKDSSQTAQFNLGPSSRGRPDRPRLSMGSERSIVSSVYNRLSIDASAVTIQHARVDQNGSFLETIFSGINNCLTIEANIDQTAQNLMQDIVISMCDDGVVAVVPVDTTINPAVSTSYDILTMRTAKILEFFPRHVRLSLYNEDLGRREDIILPKRNVAIIENPFYSVMNEQNSTLKRLIYKLNILDAIDTQSGAGKLDLIVQLPFVVKTPARQAQAEIRRKDLETQLSGSTYGVAYTDATERITQLNRPVENNLMHQIEFLTSMLYSQLGLTKEILDGTANEITMTNYYNSTVIPIMSAVTGEMKRKFLTKTARTQGQSITYFYNPFKLLPASQLGAVTDSLTRNEVLTSNEVRGIIGYRPSKEAGADTLRNKNLNAPPIDPSAPALDQTQEPVSNADQLSNV